MTTNQEGKRRAERIDLRAQTRFQIRGVSSEPVNTLSCNISTGGISFVSDKFIPPKALVMLEIDLLPRVLRPVGRVAWCQPLAHSDKNKLGVEFLELNPFERGCIEEYIREQARKRERKEIKVYG